MRDWPSKPTPHYQRAVFLDRDGTINIDTHYPHEAEKLEIIPEAIDGLKILARLPLDIIVVSNQGGIALGIFTQEQMSAFNNELRSRIERVGGRIDAFYFCPHLEPKNLSPGVPPCDCSKPRSGMLLEAAQDFDLDLPKSFIIGDKTSDIAAGEAVGCIGILVKGVKKGEGGGEGKPVPITTEHRVERLDDAARIVQSCLEREPFNKEGA